VHLIKNFIYLDDHRVTQFDDSSKDT